MQLLSVLIYRRSNIHVVIKYSDRKSNTVTKCSDRSII